MLLTGCVGAFPPLLVGMGNQLAAAQTSGSYQDQQVLQQRIGEFQLVEQLGGGRFLKSFMCLHDEGQVRLISLLLGKQ
eukprot:COSAG02_NODE_2640_length_8349_cov_40.398545_5_plen_78_part_00